MKKKRILTTQNGIALVAVMFILLILTLIIPVMYNYTYISVKSATGGTNRQRASYLARSLLEMSVAAYKYTYSDEHNDFADFKAEYKKLYTGAVDHIDSKEVSMYKEVNASGEQVKIVYANKGDADYIKYEADKTKYVFIGKGKVEITYDSTPKFFIVEQNSSTTYPIKGDDVAAKERNYQACLAELKSGQSLSPNTVRTYAVLEDDDELSETGIYTATKIHNKNVNFMSTATVAGELQGRSCVVIRPSKPADDEWISVALSDEGDLIGSGNEVHADTMKATGAVYLNYGNTDALAGYTQQPIYIFSCVGNMILECPKDTNGNKMLGNKGAELVLSVAPGLNVTPNNDPYYSIIDAINMDGYAPNQQDNNFVGFTATNSIKCDLPIKILVNPVRANRTGDWKIFGGEKNYSLYGALIFQAPTIVFNRSVDMMASFYVNLTRNKDARRMTSVVLSAPSNTPFSYRNDDRGGEVVSAGKVFFAEDCYLWVVNHGEDGTGYSENWYEVNQTVYKLNSDFVKVKIASAGDVYYFNNDIKMTDDSGKEQKTGFSLTAYAIETIYMKNYKAYTTGDWWDVWQNAKNDLFGKYIDVDTNSLLGNLLGKNDINYVSKDLYKIGNIYSDRLAVPDVDNLYTIWSD